MFVYVAGACVAAMLSGTEHSHLQVLRLVVENQQGKPEIPGSLLNHVGLRPF